MPIFPGAENASAVALPSDTMRSVETIWLAAYPLGTTMKSAVLTATPRGVVTRTLPEPAFGGTITLMLVVLEPMTCALELPRRTRFCAGTGSKLVPRMLIELPTVADGGSSAVIVGASPVAVTVNETALVTVDAPTSTLIAPLVAAGGTVAMSCVCDAESTAAAVPLKRTRFDASVALKPVP